MWRVTGNERALERRGRRLEYATTAWNVVEAFIAVGTGLAANSLALVAFGLDSCIEVFASLVVLWHLGGATEEADPARARRALQLIAVAFSLLGVYLLVQAVRGFVTRITPESSPLGTVFMAATVVVMFVLAWGKRRTGRSLGNRPLIANASLTFIDGCLAAGIVVALLADRLAGWWWADPLAAAIVGVVALNEGRENWTEASAGAKP
ncbi:MAG: cation transporter [Acidimicrobiia bacterium]|nr:cation transporter [Acidimicrobiia bacterium]